MRLTTIVPCLGNTTGCDETLASVLHHASPDSQTIVVHDGQFVDTYGLGDAIDTIEVADKPSLAKLLNAGLQAASGDIVCVLRAGAELTCDPAPRLADAFSDSSVGSVSGQMLSLRSLDKLVCSGIEASFGFNRRLAGDDMIASSRNLGRTKPLGPTLWAGFYRRSALNLVGGFDETVEDSYLDLDIALTLKQAGFVCRFEAEVTSSMDLVKPFYREADRAHGRSAQRSIRRHGNESFGRAILSGGSELISAMVNPSKLVHFSQRLLAGKFARHDRSFADRIEAVAKNRKLEQGLRISADESDRNLSRGDDTSAGAAPFFDDSNRSFRRAA